MSENKKIRAQPKNIINIKDKNKRRSKKLYFKATGGHIKHFSNSHLHLLIPLVE